MRKALFTPDSPPHPHPWQRRDPGPVLVLLLSLAATFSHANADDERLFSRGDVFGLEYANQPQWSPDGKQIVYQRHFMDRHADRIRSNLWLVNATDGGQQPLTTGARNDASPRWSPDGKRVAFIGRDEQQRAQIMMRWLDSGREAQLTQLAHAPGGLSWSPDGRWLAFHSFVPSDSQPLVKALPAPEGADWAPPPTVIDRPIFRSDGRGLLPQGHDHLFIVPADGGTPRQLTHGDYPHGGPHGGDIQWTRDGKALIFAARRHDDWDYQPQNSELYRLTLADLKVTALTTRYGPDHSPRLSPDGRWLAWLGFDDRHRGYANTQVYMRQLGADGHWVDDEIKMLTADLDRSIDDLQWSPDSDALYVQYDDFGNGKIARLDLRGRLNVVTGNVGGTGLGRPYGGGTFAVGKNDQLAYTHTTPHRPADLMLRPRHGKQRRLTQLNEDLLGPKTLARIEELRYPSHHDQREIQGWLAYPPDYQEGQQYPLLLEIHGGPFANYGDRFSAEVQLYAAAGYVVLYINPRGSTSYGDEFANLIHHAYPGHDYDDLMSGVDAVLSRGLSSKDNLFVTGGSGGGVLTAWIVGNTDRFRAAVVAKPVINWTSFVLNADLTTFFYRYWFDSPPWENQAEYWRRSPLSLAGNVVTPTMVLTGEADYRTPISESEQFYQALKLRKVDSVLVRMPGAPHFIAGRPSQLVAKIDHILAWFHKYGGTRSESAASANDAP